MSRITTTVEAFDILSQLGKELVTSYEAEDATITTIVTALLAMQVIEPNITLGTIAAGYADLTRSIKVDGDTILRALFRLRDTVGGYIYVDNDRALQWAASLGENKGQQIRYRKNLKGIERDIDYNSLVNRLYCYGAGEGTARIKLSDADGQDEDYVEDATSQGAPPDGWGGIYIGVLVDKSITHPDTLLAWANLKLAELKDPEITYRISTLDLSQSTETDYSFEALQLGSTVKIIDEDLGIDVSVKVVKIEHPDLSHPEQMILELSTRTKDITDTLLEVYDRQQFDHHVATSIGAGNVIVKGTFTVIDWVTDGETTIDGGNIETHSIVANAIKTSTLESVEITLGVGGIFKSAASPNARIEITKDEIVGYSDATTKQWWLDAATGIAYCGAGALVLDVAGATVLNAHYMVKNAGGDIVMALGFGGFIGAEASLATNEGEDLHLKTYKGDTDSAGDIEIKAGDGSDAAKVTIAAGEDIYLNPDMSSGTAHGVIYPVNSGYASFGTSSQYYNNIYCCYLKDTCSPMRQSANPLEALRKMNTKRIMLSLEDADKKAMGGQLRKRIIDAGGVLELDDTDKSTFPEEILEYPQQKDIDHYIPLYEKQMRDFRQGKRRVRPTEPHMGPATDVFAEIWLIVRAIQELAGKVEELEAKIR